MGVLLELAAIKKSFNGVCALEDGNLAVQAGEVHLLLGENGAGKSTLMKIAAGMHQPDAGEIRWQGRPVRLRRPAEAASIGVAMVHQESLLAPHLTVAENIFLGREPLKGALLDRRRMERESAALLGEHRFPLQAQWRVERLSPAQKQLVEICRAIHNASSLLIFDEPTSSLSQEETGEVFRIVRTLRERGMGVIYITHRMEELRAVGDRVTILRDGRTVATGDLADFSTEQMIRYMVGREVPTLYERTPLEPGTELLRVELPNASFRVHAGEMVGLAGLMGAGRTELCRVLFGLDPAGDGEVCVEGRPVRIHSPRDAVAAGLAFLTEDRQQTGLALRLPIRTNVTLTYLASLTRAGFLHSRWEARPARALMERLRVRAASIEQWAGRLSGGNQQKIVLAKWLFRQARVFLFDEPTRGIDVAAKAEVFALMDELAHNGAAILMVSSELPELLQVADRILVMRGGRIIKELARPTTQEEVMRYAAVGE
ncbi:MAG: sugar ABC transporter ATP-binding protein [Acidobacteria bacterium]|nr:sugar ABC transporter ATP-binding protein [Acidobacteriota bacterium]